MAPAGWHDDSESGRCARGKGGAIHSRVIRAHEDDWDEWVQRSPSDVFHSAGYHRWAQESGEGEACLAIVGDRDRGLAWPYLLRYLSDAPEYAGWEGSDVHSVYGYPGPLAWGCRPGDDFVAEAWDALLGIWRAQGVVCAFTRFHPLLGNAALLEAASGGRLVFEGRTVSVDVTARDEEVRAAYGRDLRREIDASRRRGLVTEHDHDWQALGVFVELYHATMLRVGAPEYYFFDEERLRRLDDHLPGSVHLLVTRIDGEAVAAGLFTESHGLVECLLIGTDEVHRSLSPAKVLLDDAFRWARDRGASTVHIGGGLGGHEDSLFWFKSRFSPARHRFFTGRWILDAGRYRDLTRAAAPLDGAQDPGAPDFFPAYRLLASGRARSRAAAAASLQGLAAIELDPAMPTLVATQSREHAAG
jgi:hypothetical protein